MIKIFLALFVFLTLLCANDVVKVGVLSKRGDDITIERWSSTIDYLDKKIKDHKFEIVPLSFEKLKQSVAKDEVDFVLTNTMYYVELEYLYGISRIVTLKNETFDGKGITNFGGVILTRADSNIEKIEDIKNKKFGAVNMNSFGGWVMAQKELKGKGIGTDDFSSFEFFGSHDNVVKAVKDKVVDAGTVRSDTLERMDRDNIIDIDDFKIISQKNYQNFPYLVSTELYPEWPLAKLSSTSEKLANQVAVTLMMIDNDSNILRESNVSGWTIPLDYTKVHELLQELHLGPYKEIGKLTFERFYEEYKWFFYTIIIGFILISMVVVYISNLNRKLKESKKYIEELNLSLESKVKERTAELEKMYIEERFLKNILRTISDINELLISSFSIKSITQNTLKRLIQQEKYNIVWISLIRDGNIDIVCHHKGSNDVEEYECSMNSKDSDHISRISKDSIKSNKIIIDQIDTKDYGLSWIISIPIKVGSTEEILGSLSVLSSHERGFLEEEKNMLEELSADIGTALNSVYQQSKLKEMELERISNYEETILAFVNIIEQRDSYTAGHTIRVAEYCRIIAIAMGIDEKDVVKLEKAAILHDIGKVVTPDSILLKPGKLTSLEYNLIKEHSSAGYKMLSKIKMYKDLAHIILYHHSNYNGKGYPHVDQEKLKDIPMLSHIMMVADAFDAMTSNRIYKSRKSIPEAIEELKECSGTQFHPEVVNVAVEVLKDISLRDTSQMPKSELEERRFAYFFLDSLTDLYNEDYLKIVLSKRDEKNRYLAIIELKNFSKYNKKHGWQEGNKLLKEFAIYLKERFRDSLLFRYRGDDFIIVFKEDVDAINSIDPKMLKDNDIGFKVHSCDLRETMPDLLS